MSTNSDGDSATTATVVSIDLIYRTLVMREWWWSGKSQLIGPVAVSFTEKSKEFRYDGTTKRFDPVERGLKRFSVLVTHRNLAGLHKWLQEVFDDEDLAEDLEELFPETFTSGYAFEDTSTDPFERFF